MYKPNHIIFLWELSVFLHKILKYDFRKEFTMDMIRYLLNSYTSDKLSLVDKFEL